MTLTNTDRLLTKFNRNPPTTGGAIEKFEHEAVFRLPEDYARFLMTTNGGEGFVGSCYLILWRIEELMEMNKSYQVSEYAPGLFLFGSDGGGEAFAFDMNSDTGRVVSVPFVGMDLTLVRLCGGTFQEFLEGLYQS